MQARRTTSLLAAIAAWSFAGASACEPGLEDPREAELVAVLVAADEPLLRARPALVAGKYRRMAGDLYAFYRGSFPLYLHDAGRSESGLARSEFDAEAYPFGLGDAHPENFGTLRATDGSFAIEPNDLDGADRYPFLWELRRLAVGLVLAARSSNAEDAEARAAAIREERRHARAVALGYAAELTRLHAGGAPERVVDDRGVPHFDDLFSRSLRDERDRRELGLRTEIEGGRRRLRRGGIDEDDPESRYVDLEDVVREAIPATVARYRETLLAPPPAAYFALKDAARAYGSGVASFARVRIALLVEGPTEALEDDVILELKELPDSGAVPVAPQGVWADSVGERVRMGRALAWTRPDADPLWGTSTLLGLTVQLKGDFDAYKTLRIRRMEGDRGTPASLEALGAALGAILARVHAASERRWPGTRAAIAAAVTDAEAFADEQADVAVAYADVVEADHARFVHALDALGPTLGVRASAGDAPDRDLAALYGVPQ